MSRLKHGLPFQIIMILSEFHRRIRAGIKIFKQYKRYVNHDCSAIKTIVDLAKRYHRYMILGVRIFFYDDI